MEWLVHALRQCNASAHHVFQGQLVSSDLNQDLLEKLDHIRLGFDTTPVAREAKPRQQNANPVELVSPFETSPAPPLVPTHGIHADSASSGEQADLANLDEGGGASDQGDQFISGCLASAITSKTDRQWSFKPDSNQNQACRPRLRCP